MVGPPYPQIWYSYIRFHWPRLTMIYKDFIINLFITRGSVDNREFESKFSEINFFYISIYEVDHGFSVIYIHTYSYGD